MTHYLHLKPFQSKSQSTNHVEKQPHHLTELYSHMQYSSILGWKSSYKSVPANTKRRNTSVYSTHTAHMKQNIAAITECRGCGGLVSHYSSSGSTDRIVRVCRTVRTQRYAQSRFSDSIHRQTRVLLQTTWVLKQAHPNEQTLLFQYFNQPNRTNGIQNKRWRLIKSCSWHLQIHIEHLQHTDIQMRRHTRQNG